MHVHICYTYVRVVLLDIGQHKDQPIPAGFTQGEQYNLCLRLQCPSHPEVSHGPHIPKFRSSSLTIIKQGKLIDYRPGRSESDD